MGPVLRAVCACESGECKRQGAARERLQLSRRAFHHLPKLARTIADLAEAETIAAPHLAETLHYRPQVDVG